MTHATPRPRPPGPTTRAERYAALCEEFINATPERREAIGEEIEGLMARRVVPLMASGKPGDAV